ncbi:hypothetical protein AAG570_002728 [Ranatra chinensis]|uniref:Uncharacterized protein n=1 Tax=Ranatra chinensis TaxID=642074 RepID=A0ABD0YMJ5_9HEMI
MESKRRNMFQKNKMQETTENAVRSAESSRVDRIVMKGGSDVSLPMLEASSGGQLSLLIGFLQTTFHLNAGCEFSLKMLPTWEAKRRNPLSSQLSTSDSGRGSLRVLIDYNTVAKGNNYLHGFGAIQNTYDKGK